MCRQLGLLIHSTSYAIIAASLRQIPGFCSLNMVDNDDLAPDQCNRAGVLASRWKRKFLDAKLTRGRSMKSDLELFRHQLALGGVVGLEDVGLAKPLLKSDLRSISFQTHFKFSVYHCRCATCPSNIHGRTIADIKRSCRPWLFN
jgi:hypothetical protein